MIGQALIFCLITFGVTMVVSIIVAAIIKLIAAAIQKAEGTTKTSPK